jgi:hypothetical protein
MDTLRLSDADREAAVALLGEHYAIGRLTKDEFDERSDAVWSARTRGDLAPVFVDLPAPPSTQPTRAAARPPGRARPRRVPLLALVLVVLAIALLTELPLVLAALALWFVLGRCHTARWGGHGSSRR